MHEITIELNSPWGRLTGVHAGPIRFDRRARSGEQFRAITRHCLAQILPHAGQLAQGSTDDEQVHQLRLGLRRLLAALRELGDMATDASSAWQAPMLQAAHQLGVFRDQSVVARTVQARLVAAGAPDVEPWTWTSEDNLSPRQVVRATPFQSTLMDLIAFCIESAPLDNGLKPAATRKLLASRLAHLHHQVVTDGKRFTKLTPEAQHRVRKRLKRLRCLSEFAAPIFGRRRVDQYLLALQPALKALGLHRDDAAALATCRVRTEQDPRAWWAVGWLSASQLQTARQCQRALNKVRTVAPFWD